MTIAELVLVDGIPALAPAQTHLRRVYATLDRVQVFRRRCSEVLEQCVTLLIALHRETDDSDTFKDLEKVTTLTEQLDTDVSDWAGLGPLQSFLRRNDIKQAIHGLLQDINAAMAKHSVPNTLEHLRSEISLERDNSEIRDVLQVVVSNTTEMHTLLSMQSEEPLREVMETLQIELYDAQLIEPVRSNFIRALWFLHEQTNRLPPLTDLTGQITFDVVDHILSGNTYSGEWLGTEKVELKAPRSLANTPDARKRFEREVGKWRHLKHDNIVSLYGIVFTGPDLFTVQPWFNRGTAINFVQKNPDVDRLKILNDIAAGLEYLHKENIIHGDLRGANVLIANNGSALLSGFGIVSFLEDDGNGIASSDTVNPRWSAPELLRNHGSTSKQSDVWSFAMVALELMTGQPPYSNTPRDITVLRELDQGKIPDHPGRAATLRGLSDGLWSFMRKCWHKRPDSRPLAAAANCRLRQLRGIGLPFVQKKTFFFPRPSTADGTSPSADFTLSSISPGPALLSPAKLYPALTAQSIGHRRPSSTGAVVHPEDSASRPSFHSDRSSQAKFGPHLGQLYLSHDHSTPTLLPDSDSDLHSATSGSSQYSLPDSLMLLNDPSNGTVYAGDLDGLVDKLLSPAAFPNDLERSEFQEVVFSTCHDFTTPEMLLSTIIQRFHDSQALQSNVFVVLTLWVSSSRLRVHPRVLSQIKQFCLTVISTKTSSLVVDARHLFHMVEQRATLNNTPPVSPSSTKIPRTADILPRDLAIALTLLEGDNYWSILPADYLSHLRKIEGHNNVDAASSENNRVVLWVKKSLLTPSRVETRVDTLKFFLQVAHHCRMLRNFSSLAAIVAGIASIERLTLTVGALSPHLHEMLQELKNLLDPSNNHLTYRAALKPEEALDPQYRDFCIPWLGVHLRDLHSLLQNYPPTLEIQGRSLINFRRYYKFMEHVRGLRLFKPPDLERYRNGQLAYYLQHQLRGVHFDADTDVALMERSLELEADETRIHRTRALELKRLGFRSS